MPTLPQDSSPHANLRLSVATLKNGEYQLISENIQWHIKATQVFHAKQLMDAEHSSAEPTIDILLSPGVYTITAKCDLGEHTVPGVVIHPGSITDEVIYFGKIGIDDQEERYDLNSDKDFDLESEFTRRHAERDGQRSFAEASDDLRDPNILPESDPEFEFDPSQQEGQFKQHPILSKATQFDGIAATLNQDTNRSQHAQENVLNYSKQNQPQAGPSMPAPRPGGV